MTDQQPAEPAEPGKGALDNPAVSIATQLATVFVPPDGAVLAIRHDHGDAAGGHPRAERVTVVGAVRDQALGLAVAAAMAHAGSLQCRVDEGYMRRAGRGYMYSQRNTLAVDHHHALRTLAALGFADVRAPFFADANVPSMNTCSQRIRPRASSCSRNARHMASHVPSRSHCRSRRQHVEPLGYSSGRSRQRAPVLSTHRIPSTTRSEEHTSELQSLRHLVCRPLLETKKTNQ